MHVRSHEHFRKGAIGMWGEYRDFASGGFSFYRNGIHDYIYPRSTGETDVRTLLPIFQQTGAEALMEGLEVEIEVRPHRLLRAEASTSEGRDAGAGPKRQAALQAVF